MDPWFCRFHPKEIVDQSVRKRDQVLIPGISWHIVPAAVAYKIWFIWSSVSCFTSLCERRSDTIRYDQIQWIYVDFCGRCKMPLISITENSSTIPSEVFFSLVVDSQSICYFSPRGNDFQTCLIHSHFMSSSIAFHRIPSVFWTRHSHHSPLVRHYGRPRGKRRSSPTDAPGEWKLWLNFDVFGWWWTSILSLTYYPLVMEFTVCHGI